MESRAAANAATAATEDAGAFASPIKPVSCVLRSHTKPPAENQIATPQKAPEPPRFTRGPGVVYSLRQVKRAVIGLHKADEAPPDAGKGREDEDAGEDAAMADERPASSVPRPIDLGRKLAKAESKLPEKYEMLGRFFHSLKSSYRLLRLKRQMCTFSNIAPKIEYLTDKRFTYGHLAQLKHIVPEAISVKKILSLDEATSCMKPDLQITLVSNAFGDSFEGKRLSGYSVLTKVFRSRLLAFSEELAEDEEIPEDELPEPFICKKPVPSVDRVEESNPACVPSLPVTTDEQESQSQPAVSSQLSRSFQRRFSQNGRLVDKLPSVDELAAPETEPMNPAPSSPNKCPRKTHIRPKALPANMISLMEPDISCEGTPKKLIECHSFSQKSFADATPVRLLSTPARLMCPTPDLKTPKRSRTDVEDNPRLSKKPVRRPLTLAEEGRETDDDTTKADSDLEDAALHFLPRALLRSVREREKKAMEDQQQGVSEKRKRQQMLACLPKLFDMILFTFQSVRRSVITKEELISKIIAGHFDIADRSEVEEQLALLQELLPEWISGKIASSGDYIFSIDKLSSPEMMRQKLAEVN